MGVADSWHLDTDIAMRCPPKRVLGIGELKGSRVPSIPLQHHNHPVWACAHRSIISIGGIHWREIGSDTLPSAP